MIKQKYLKEMLHYDNSTGVFVWIKPKANRIKIGDIAGTVRKDGYISITVDNKRYLAHRLAWVYENGYISENIDHINGNPSDNSIQNLRAADYKENGKNTKKYINNTSGVVGISYRKDRNQWRARINHDGKMINLGSYNEKDEAIEARQNAEKKYKYHNNHGR